MFGADSREPAGRGGQTAIGWYRRLVVLALAFSFLFILVSVGSLVVLLNKPYGGFLWEWNHATGTYRVASFSPQGAAPLQPVDSILAVGSEQSAPSETYTLAQAHYQSAAFVCSDTSPDSAPVVHYRVLRRGEELDIAGPVRCFTLVSLLRIAAIPVVLALLIWAIAIVVYRADPARELNLAFALCMAWTAAIIAKEGSNVTDFYSPFGRTIALALGTPMPILAAASLYHLVAILPRQHPSRWLMRTRWLWYCLIPLALIVLGTARYVISPVWTPLIGQIDRVAWWGTVLFVTGVAVTVAIRYTRIYLATRSRQAKSQVRLILASLLMVFAAIPFVIAQREPHRLTGLPVNQPVLLFWLVPVFIIIAFAILRFQVYPGRVQGLRVLVGLAVTVIVGMLASPILNMDPEVGFVVLLIVLATTSMFWALPNRIMKALRRFALPGTIDLAMLERFSADIQHIYDQENLSQVIVQSLEQHLRLRHAALWLEQEPGVLTLEAFTDRAPADNLPYELVTDQVWHEQPTRMQDGPIKILLPLVAGGRRLGVIGLGERWTEEIFDDTDLTALQVMADQAALVLGTARHLRILRLAPLEIEQAQLEERDRIAQDLHDSTQAQLTQLAFALERVRSQLYTDPSRAEGLLDGCIGDVNQAARDLRAILRDLIPERLYGQTLAAILHEDANSLMASYSPVEIGVHAAAEIEDLLSASRRMALLRICQQALNNALRHAGAGAISVTLKASEDQQAIEFSIVDDGCGFVLHPLNQFVEQGHYGLYIMTSRTILHGGQLTVDSTPGLGTVIKGVMPTDCPPPRA